MVPAEFMTLDGSISYRMVEWPPMERYRVPLMEPMNAVRVGYSGESGISVALDLKVREFELAGGDRELLQYREVWR